MKLALAALIAAGAALGACAPYAPAPHAALAPLPGVDASAAERQCFRTHDIRSHTVGDKSALYINVSGREVYRIGMSDACLAGAISSDPLVMRQPPGSSMVCRPIDLDIAISRSGGFAMPCIVSSITRLTPTEVAALPAKLRP